MHGYVTAATKFSNYYNYLFFYFLLLKAVSVDVNDIQSMCWSGDGALIGTISKVYNHNYNVI